MTSISMPTPDAAAAAPLRTLRRLRFGQAMTLTVVADTSVAAGLVIMVLHPAAGPGGFVAAVGLEFVIWGGIDLVFGVVGLVQSFRARRTPVSLQAEIDEFAAAEKLLRALRFNHKLNVGYLVMAAALLAWAGWARSPVLAGHGVGVLVQGGFLFAFDLFYQHRIASLLGLQPRTAS